MIEQGQIYRSCQPVRSEPEPRHTRIKVVGKPIATWGRYGYGKVDIVTLTDDGREIRRRRIRMDQLHDSPTARDGQPRRTGYALETP